jgi:uncharacterized circularly permuted ATP-grasp superfamily protein
MNSNKEIINKLKTVTYNVYDAEKELVRPWKLDPIPFVLHQSEWEIIEKGLIQREFTRFDLQGYLWGTTIN